MANPPLTLKTLRGYAEDVARMVRQLENSQHHEAAKQGREFYRHMSAVRVIPLHDQRQFALRKWLPNIEAGEDGRPVRDERERAARG